ncbi:hypothetical protein IEQ34_022092 [Dendrobium chrysotoxum]|uniref:Uncharacterized protein n=1 Tax=Dendrobium chrysotoxum TaxID=161865 RepID=A0AAV7FXZ2_DENCH|nr:hypothetical protein IEQ34_022092 [Dendrobium chrysotoxum]
MQGHLGNLNFPKLVSLKGTDSIRSPHLFLRTEGTKEAEAEGRRTGKARTVASAVVSDGENLREIIEEVKEKIKVFKLGFFQGLTFCENFLTKIVPIGLKKVGNPIVGQSVEQDVYVERGRSR